ncbi:D-alanyl-D-alanine carboxypeptidase [Streptomyces huasconensis]|uniref:D-alanyl-D-alanine carboxypeptidase n=1 Tax=Streptomyces huasconensis TaxID=1854574 RepID=UPI0036FD806F
MAYEEASVAGETPDRSKQRKSSGNPTAADPSVPAPEERDPRLAVAREVPAARKDQATAVFSTKGVSEGRDATSEGSAAAASDGEGGGDGRLRDAVAAWVAGSDDEHPEADRDGSRAPGASGEDDEAESSSDGPAEAAGAASGDEAARGETTSGGADSDGDDAPAKPAGGAKPSGDAKPADGAKPGEGAKPSGDAEVSGNAGSGGDAKAGVESDGDAKGGADTKPAEAAKVGGDAKPATPAKAGDAAEPKATDAKPADAKATDAKATDPKPKAADAEPKAADAPEPKSDAPKPAKSAGVDQPTAVFKAPSRKPEVDQPTTMLKLGGEAAAKKGAEEDAKQDAKPGAKAERDSERTSKFVALKPLDEPSGKSKTAPKAGVPAAKPAAGAKADPKADAKTAEQPPAPVEPTTQQPLPPKPPLDLLAELTNTPPPPETPVRTAVRRVKIWTPIVLLLVVVFAVVQAVRPLPSPTLKLTAEQSVSFGGDKPSVPWPSQGQAAMDVNGIGSFGTSGDQKPVPIASIAKVMTVYVILRDHPLEKGKDGPKIPVDAAAEKHYKTGKAEQESVVRVAEGQKITQYEALQAVMLPSANNIAKLLARWDSKSGSEDAFVAKMNKTAKELGMKNTHYTDPSGLDKTTVSTAEDLVKLGRAAMKNPVFNEISRQPSYKDLNGEKQNNFFGLVPTVAIGIKTGTTTAAGGNILFAAEKKVGGETQTIIGAALGQFGKNGVANIDEVTGVTRKLIEAGQDALTAKTIVKKGDVVGQVDDGLGGTTPVVATKDVSAVGWPGLTVKLHMSEPKGKPVPHTAKAGTAVGVLSVGDGKGDAIKVPVALQKDLAEPGLGAKLKRVG